MWIDSRSAIPDHDSGGKRFPVLNIQRVVQAYLHSWFFVDLFAAIPFDRFVDPASADKSPLVRIPGLIKVVRLLKLRRTIRKWASLSYGPVLKVCTIIGGWLLIAHCAQIASGILTPRAYHILCPSSHLHEQRGVFCLRRVCLRVLCPWLVLMRAQASADRTPTTGTVPHACSV